MSLDNLTKTLNEATMNQKAKLAIFNQTSCQEEEEDEQRKAST